MRVLLDENVGLSTARRLHDSGHEVLAIAETTSRGIADAEVWSIAREGSYLLITRDYHFTNSVRFPPSECLGILFVRHGNLTAEQEGALVARFLNHTFRTEHTGRLIVLSPGSVRIRPGI